MLESSLISGVGRPADGESDRAIGDCPALEVDRLTYSYAESPVLENLSLRLNIGDYACLLGGSGSGKTTLLQLIAGTKESQQGSISIGGRCVADRGRNLHVPPENRAIGMVFQDQALWPHLSVQAHVEFPLRARKLPINRKVLADLLTRLGLSGLEHRKPGALSGGQRQRVGLARALAGNPSLLLLDEPLSAVDTAMRQELREYLHQLFKDLRFTALHVTHDPEEAFQLATHVGVLERGRLVQWGSPEQIYRRPANLNVARLSGACSAVVVDCVARHGSSARILWEGCTFEIPAHNSVAVGRASLVLRPDALTAAPRGFDATLIDARFQGDRWIALAKIGASEPIPIYLNEVPHRNIALQLNEAASWLLPLRS